MRVSAKLQSSSPVLLLTTVLLLLANVPAPAWADSTDSAPATRPSSRPSPEEIKTIQAIQCTYNLHEIGQAIVLYSTDHRGFYPSDLGALAIAQKLDLSIFVCPASPNALPDHWQDLPAAEKGAWINAHTDYIYVGAKWSEGNIKPDAPMVYEKDDDHGSSMHILFADGHIEFLPLDEVHRRFGESLGAERVTSRVKPTPEQILANPPITMDQAKALLAKMDIDAVSTALEEFEIDNGRFPTTQEGLAALIQNPGGKLKHWKHAYIDRLPNDPWNHPYVYVCPGVHANEFDLFSCGPDGQPNTPDDVKP